MIERILSGICRALGLEKRRVAAAVELLDDGCTVPFIARYRKDKTGALSDVELRELVVQLERREAVEARRDTILRALTESGKLTPALATAVDQAEELRTLEDIYRPHKTRRKTKADKAKELGLEPLARSLLDARGKASPEALARRFVGAKVASAALALSGAKDILVDDFAQEPRARAVIREERERGRMAVKAARGKADEAKRSVYRELVGLDRPIERLPAHRILAIDRGEDEGFLSVSVRGRPEVESRRLLGLLLRRGVWPSRSFVEEAIGLALKDRIGPAVERELRREHTDRAQAQALDTFRRNLRQLLLQPTLKRSVVLGIDPGFRSGCKLAAVDALGEYLAHETIQPHQGAGQRRGAAEQLRKMVAGNRVEVIAIGNGTAGRETTEFVREALAEDEELAKLRPVTVSESGASVYSASAVAQEEHPELDVTIRGALSIARRLQDPLAELVKIEPWHLGVGQYQHDLDQRELARSLNAVVEDVVAAVGVDLNRASVSLLERVAGLGAKRARALVELREKRGPFRGRSELKQVPGLGPKSFQQVAGFLRIPDAFEPLDRSAVHPESYALARRIAASVGQEIAGVMAHPETLAAASPESFVSEGVGLATIADIMEELARPGRDPRGEPRDIAYTDGVEEIEDLKPGMELGGTVTNLTDFGAFVDLGVHRDGLIHISRFGKRVEHPTDAVSIGQRVKVQVESVDIERHRIGLRLLS